jgi:hypothetical protein
MQYANSSFSVGRAAVATERHVYAVCARRTERWDAHIHGGGAGRGGGRQLYEQEAAAVEEEDKMEREDEGGVAKRPDFNELRLDVPE